MKPIDSKTLLDSLEIQVERHLQTAIHTLQNLPRHTLQQPAANGGWSIAQCLWHINSYGHYYLPQVEKALAHRPAKTNTATTFTGTWLGAYFTRLMQPRENMKKLKAFKNHVPPAQPDGGHEVAEFIRHQEQWLQLLRQSHGADLTGTRIPISISRWVRLRLGDVLQFYMAHQERHLVQALRNV